MGCVQIKPGRFRCSELLPAPGGLEHIRMQSISKYGEEGGPGQAGFEPEHERRAAVNYAGYVLLVIFYFIFRNNRQ